MTAMLYQSTVVFAGNLRYCKVSKIFISYTNRNTKVYKCDYYMILPMPEQFYISQILPHTSCQAQVSSIQVTQYQQAHFWRKLTQIWHGFLYNTVVSSTSSSFCCLCIIIQSPQHLTHVSKAEILKVNRMLKTKLYNSSQQSK